MTATVQQSSAAGVLSLLNEPDEDIKIYALEQLNQMVDTFWSEIAHCIPDIETLYEDEKFQNRALAAVVASKVFYHLEDLDDALKYALGAGDLFDVTQTTQYVQTLVSKCIDEYISLRKAGKDDIDQRLVSVVERMFERCFDAAKYKQALGIAIESQRLDVIRKCIVDSGDSMEDLLLYTFTISQKVVDNRDFRKQVLTALIGLYRSLATPDYISMCQCLLFLNDHQSVADVLNDVILNDPQNDGCLVAYQVAFELAENQHQPFLLRVCAALPASDDDVNAKAGSEGSDDTDGKEVEVSSSPDAVSDVAVDASAETSGETSPLMGGDNDANSTSLDTDENSYSCRLQKLKSILRGNTSSQLYLRFLYSYNHSDLIWLGSLKDKLDPRNSVTHNALVMTHSLMHLGTSIDVFLRDNMEWLGKAKNWAKFNATASMGVIHQGHHEKSRELLDPYLPKPGKQASPYQEGGALYALGLIHANHNGSQTEYLLEQLREAGTNEIKQHGACLGLGLSGMATGDAGLFQALNAVVSTESAVAGEAAGIAMGLVLLGSGNAMAVEEMLEYARDTQHEKIIRGLSLGVALIVYGREEEANHIIDDMLQDKDYLLRYGAMHAIAMAYVGTSNNSAIKRLLHVAVSDTSDDVRRAAVTALGFVLCNAPEQVPRIVSLLAESFNAHVRYGAALAVGIACAGSGSAAALSLLEPMLKDRVDYVRQAAFIAFGMVCIQSNEKKEPKVKVFKDLISSTLSKKGDTMTKLGAILGAGILDAGGRNVSIALLSPAGHKKMAAIVGMMLFPNFWYWFPMVHFLSLSFTPTAIIGLNHQMKMPKSFQFASGAPPSLFAYPAPMEIKKEEVKKKVKTATLSVTAKAKARAKKKTDTDGDTSMASNASDVDDDGEACAETESEVSSKEKESEDAEEKEEKAEKEEKEASFEVCDNPARVTWAQQSLLSFSQTQRFAPITSSLSPGFVMLRDTNTGSASASEEVEFVVFDPPKMRVHGVDDDEPEPPADFEFLG